MQIGIRLQGGLGDIICGHRFAYAVKEKYPKAELIAFLRANDFELCESVLATQWPSFYKSIRQVNYNPRVNVTTDFGETKWNSAREADGEAAQKAYEACDKFFDFHIDRMEWLNYDLPIQRYLHWFPPFENPLHAPSKNYLLLHLDSAISSGHKLSKKYIHGLIEKLAEDHELCVLCTPENEYLYEDINDTLIQGGIWSELNFADEVTSFIENAKLLLCVDTGTKYIGYCANTPTLCFSENSRPGGVCTPAHEARWLIYPHLHLPLDTSQKMVKLKVNQMLENRGSVLFSTNSPKEQLVIRNVLHH